MSEVHIRFEVPDCPNTNMKTSPAAVVRIVFFIVWYLLQINDIPGR